MGASAAEALGQVQRGRVTTLFCENVFSARRQIRNASEQQEPIPTLVSLEWERIPSLVQELDEIRNALADAAASLWPNWYVTAEQRFSQTDDAGASVESLIAKMGVVCPKASGSWLREAASRCEVGKRPVVRNMASAEQVKQLALALDPSGLLFALSVEFGDAPAARVRGLAKAAEWLAHEAGAKTLLLVPGPWQSKVELDHVTYGSLYLDHEEPYSPSYVSECPPSTLWRPRERTTGHTAEAQTALATPKMSGGPQVSVGPIVGQPHPGSEVEQLVCSLLKKDDELAGLFQYNQRLLAFEGKHYIVDLLWRKGGLIVELDGPEHSGRVTYHNDRERDYRLLMSGYSTLRIPNAEVYVNPASVITKIRNVVRQLRPSKERNRPS